MPKKVKIVFEGLINDFESVKIFRDLLLTFGSKYLIIVDSSSDADLKVDISDIGPTIDITKEAGYVIVNCKKIQGYKNKRKKAIKKTKEKLKKIIHGTKQHNRSKKKE